MEIDEDFILWTIGIIVAILLAFFSPKLYYFMFGSLEIDFKENDILVKDGTPYVKIEVLNQLGYSLLYVNGTATLNCDGLMGSLISNPFRLEGNYDFLGHGTKSEFLLSPDQSFIDLIKTRDIGCSDVSFQFAKYEMFNKTHAKLTKVDSFEANGEENININKKSYFFNESNQFFSCERCEVIISIYASNIKKPFTKIEYTSFVGSIKNQPFQGIMRKPEYIEANVNQFFNSRISFSQKYGPCKGMSGKDCASFLCKKIREQNIADTYCDQYQGYQRTISIPVYPLNYPEMSSQYPK